MKEFYRKVYENYERLRDAEGLNNYQVSLRLGISTSMFSEWKSDISRPKIETLLKIADLFGVSLDMLLEGAKEADEQSKR